MNIRDERVIPVRNQDKRALGRSPENVCSYRQRMHHPALKTALMMDLTALSIKLNMKLILEKTTISKYKPTLNM